MRVLDSRVAKLVPQGRNRGRVSVWALGNHTKLVPDASVPLQSGHHSPAEHEWSLANLHVVVDRSLAPYKCGHWQTKFALEYRLETGADQACQGEVGRTSTVMEKLTGIRSLRGGP